MFIEEVKKSIDIDIIAAKDVNDKCYREADEKSKKICKELIDRLHKKVNMLTDNEVVELSCLILDGEVNDYTHLIMNIIGDKLLDSKDIRYRELGELISRASMIGCINVLRGL